MKKEIFFTHNGNFLGRKLLIMYIKFLIVFFKKGTPFKNVDIIEFYPTIGLHSQYESIKFNLELKFNLEELLEQEKQYTREEVLNTGINSFEVHQIVHSYLYYQGYYKFYLINLYLLIIV